jgi:hypothetical protein
LQRVKPHITSAQIGCGASDQTLPSAKTVIPINFRRKVSTRAVNIHATAVNIEQSQIGNSLAYRTRVDHQLQVFRLAVAIKELLSRTGLVVENHDALIVKLVNSIDAQTELNAVNAKIQRALGINNDKRLSVTLKLHYRFQQCRNTVFFERQQLQQDEIRILFVAKKRRLHGSADPFSNSRFRPRGYL